MDTQNTQDIQQDLKGEFFPTELDVSNFCGNFNGYLKGSINGWACNGEFTTYHLKNAILKGIFKGTMNAYGVIKKCEKTELPDEYLKGDYDFYLDNDSEEEDESGSEEDESELDEPDSVNEHNTMN